MAKEKEVKLKTLKDYRRIYEKICLRVHNKTLSENEAVNLLVSLVPVEPLPAVKPYRRKEYDLKDEK